MTTMTTRILAASIFVLAVVAAPARAAVQVTTISPPAAVPDPLDAGFTINYTLGGSSVLASAQLTFFVSATRDGSSGAVRLGGRQLVLRGTGTGPFLPPIGTQSQFFNRFSLEPNALAALQNIAAACQPQSLFIIANVDGGPVQGSTSSVVGTVKLPDFVFTGGTISPTVIQPGGTTSISFDLSTQCPVTQPSRVGVFLTDPSFNLVSVIGFIPIGTGAGTFSLPPSPITFSTATPPGNYNILLIADFDGAVAESNENNNGGAFALTVTAAATAGRRGTAGELAPVALLPDLAAAGPATDGLATLGDPASR